MSNRTRIRTRFGQILERVTGHSLELAGLKYRLDWQYSDDAIKLDFTLPDTDQPTQFVEVTQTQARNVLQRKLLRYFEQVAQAKIHFGTAIEAVTLIYGEPTRDLPPANLAASLSFFDKALMPRVDEALTEQERIWLADLEESALNLAREGINQSVAVERLAIMHPEAFQCLASYFQRHLAAIQPNPLLTQMWKMEQARVAKINIPEQLSPINTAYKRGILQALFLKGEKFDKLIRSVVDERTGKLRIISQLDESTEDLLQQVERLGLASTQKTIAGVKLIPSPELKAILLRPSAQSMVTLARRRLATNDLRWFFEDIYDQKRRLQMAEHYLQLVQSGVEGIQDAIYQNLMSDKYAGVHHTRCWVADCLCVHLEMPQNNLNNLLVAQYDYTSSIPNPFNNIVTRSARILNDKNNLEMFAQITARIWAEAPRRNFSSQELCDAILSMRIDGAMYLQRFNPFYVVVEQALDEAGYSYVYEGVPSILGDLVDNPQVGRFKVYRAQKGSITLILNALQIRDAHKPKEWAARARAMRYRIEQTPNGQSRIVTQLDKVRFVFVLDGKLTTKMRRQLEWAGWTTLPLEELAPWLASLTT